MEKGQPKKYGLIISSKKKAIAERFSAFAESSSEDEDEGKKMKKSSLWRENRKNAQVLESRGQVVKALKEDPSVFEYDGIYDQMQEKKRKEDPRLATKDKNSKYIANLKKVAERRKLEQEIIYERKVQRELEREGKQAEEQETFLTSAYRNKLEERRQLEEELKLEAHQEEVEDVTKQKDMSRFHRTLLNKMTTGGGAEEEEPRRHEQHGRTSSSGESSKLEENSSRERVLVEDDEGNPSSVGPAEQEPKTGDSEPEHEEVPATDPGLSSSPSPPLGDDHLHDNRKEDGGQGSSIVEAKPQEMSKEEKRTMLTAKRTNEDALSSAKERYLARKRAKISAPIVSTDD